MKTRQNLILLIVLLVCAGFILVLEHPLEQKAVRKAAGSDRLFPELRPEAVRELTIRLTDAEIVRLAKNEDRWLVMYKGEQYPADQEMVKEALTILVQLTQENLASQKKEKHDLFQVTAEKGIEVIVRDAGKTPAAHLFIGRQGPDLYSTYIRIASSDAVYRSNAFSSGIFDQPPPVWRDTTLFSFDPEEATELQITSPDQTIVLSRDTAGAWHMQEPVSGRADPEVLKALLAGLASLEASDYADNVSAAESGLERSTLRLTVMLRDGSRKDLTIGSHLADQPLYYLATGDTPYTYVLHERIVHQLNPPVHTLQKSDTTPDDDTQSRSEALPESSLPSPGR